MKGSTAKPLTSEEAEAATAQPASRTVAAGLEYLAKLEADNATLKIDLEHARTANKLATLEIEDLRGRLNISESRVAELQARSDQSVAENARILGVLDVVRKAVAWPVFNGTTERGPSLAEYVEGQNGERVEATTLGH